MCLSQECQHDHVTEAEEHPVVRRKAGCHTGIMAKDTVKLISAEGFEFIVDYQAACVSNTIKNMLSSTGKRAFYQELFIRLGIGKLRIYDRSLH